MTRPVAAGKCDHTPGATCRTHSPPRRIGGRRSEIIPGPGFFRRRRLVDAFRERDRLGGDDTIVGAQLAADDERSELPLDHPRLDGGIIVVIIATRRHASGFKLTRELGVLAISVLATSRDLS
jgi:hypothetical protein